MKTLTAFSDMTPNIDKGLTVIGAGVAALTLSDVSTVCGVAVAIATFCMVVPRMILNWIELKDSNKAHKEARDKAKRLLEDADRESSDY